MKSFTILSIAAVALLFASCAKVETKDGGQTLPNDPSRIGFSFNTGSRALDSDLATIETLGSTGGGLYISQIFWNPTGEWERELGFSQLYAYDAAKSTWDWKTNPTDAMFKWPAAGDSKYPMFFYATYPTAPLNSGDVGGDEPLFFVSVNPKVEDQIDILLAATPVFAPPANGKVQLNFIHLLSKILFNIKGATDVAVNIQSIKVVNVSNNDWLYDPSLMFWAYPDILENSVLDYAFRTPTMNGGVAQSITPASDGDLVAVTNDGAGALMLIPQWKQNKWNDADFRTKAKAVMAQYAKDGTSYADILTSWVTDMTADAWKGSRIEVVYNIQRTTPTTEWLVGGLNEFVRVGYSIDLTATDEDTSADTDKRWISGKQYSYNIELGTTDASGGILLDPFYTDGAGNGTNKPVTNPSLVDPGNKVSTGGYIGFKLSVDDWTDQPNTIK